MRVITLSTVGFTRACRDLWEGVEKSGWVPGLIIGIETGGACVSREIEHNCNCAVNFSTLRCQRPATKVKNRFNVNFFLKRLPVFFNDKARVFEHYWRVLTYRSGKSERIIESSDSLLALLEGESKILIVDDAVDSGETLAAVLVYVRSIAPGADIKTAAITKTWNAPRVKLNYFLFEKTLVRFPWSFDSKSP